MLQSLQSLNQTKLSHSLCDKAVLHKLSQLSLLLYIYTPSVMQQSSDCLFTVKMLLGKQELSTQALTLCICNLHQPHLISSMISHILLCQYLICPSQASFQPLLLFAAQPLSSLSP